MIPLSLSIQNFGPFKDRVMFEFPREPGLYFLGGENQEEPRLGANGAGKSKLWEALVWCVYGKTSRGLKAGDAANWEAPKGCEVVFTFLRDAHSLPEFVTRTWGPISWTFKDLFGTVHDLAKDSNPLLAALKLELIPFLNCILMAQGEPMFLDLKAEAKATLFTSVMDLDRWADYSKRAGEKASEEWRKASHLGGEVQALEAQIEQTDKTVLEGQHDEWLHQRNRKLDEIEAEYARLSDREEKAAKQLKDIQEAEDVSRSKLKKLLSLRDEARGEATRSVKMLNDLLREHAVLASRVAVARDTLNAVCDRKTCPTCNQGIPLDARRAATAASEETFNRLEYELSALDIGVEHAEEVAQACEDRVQATQSDVRVAEEVVDSIASQARAIRIERDRIGARLDSLEADEDALMDAVNPFRVLMDQHDQQLVDLRATRDRLHQLIDEVSYSAARLEGWVKWFKAIRLDLIAAALNELEIEVNSCVNAKGLVGWSVRFEVDRETKSGSVQRGFNVSIQSPHNERPVPWESWSGGEGQRLRVATQEGLANLIRSRTGATLNLEVWDEPTQWLSTQGVLDLLDSFAERARTEKRQIWIVDHRVMSYGNFTGSSMVIKTKEGVSQFDQSGLYK